MTALPRPERSLSVAVWLGVVALLVLAMVVVGGATRLTDSGLSITEWKPVTGAIPPLNAADWQAEFARYKAIPQYELVNRGMSLAEFQTIYWWEWGHRALGRIVGLVFALPLVWFAVRRRIPRRLTSRLAVLFVLGGLQGAVGWWMVASGLSERVSVAPERLATHLGLAFILLAALVWTALDAWAGPPRRTHPGPWGRRALGLLALIFLQILLGALVAGNDAGRIYTDFPLMNGRLVPETYGGGTLWATLAHNPAAVQFHHRLGAYAVLLAALVLAALAWRAKDLGEGARLAPAGVALIVLGQSALGIATLAAAAPLSLGLAHQLMAALLWVAATVLAWRMRRV